MTWVRFVLGRSRGTICFTACDTWLPVAFLSSTVGPLLQAANARIDAMT